MRNSQRCSRQVGEAGAEKAVPRALCRAATQASSWHQSSPTLQECSLMRPPKEGTASTRARLSWALPGQARHLCTSCPSGATGGGQGAAPQCLHFEQQFKSSRGGRGPDMQEGRREGACWHQAGSAVPSLASMDPGEHQRTAGTFPGCLPEGADHSHCPFGSRFRTTGHNPQAHTSSPVLTHIPACNAGELPSKRDLGCTETSEGQALPSFSLGMHLVSFLRAPLH